MPHQQLDEHHGSSDAERDILLLISRGDSDGEICQILDIEYEALKSRRRRFVERSGLSSRRLVAWAARHESCCLA